MAKAPTTAREIKTKVDNCVLYTDGCLRIDLVRGSYLHLDQPWGGKPFRDKQTGEIVTPKKKYQGKFWMPQKPEFVPARKLVVARVNECMADAKIEALASEKKFIRKGSDLGKPELKEFYVITASEDNPPALRDRAGKKITDPVKIKKELYSGAWYSILIRPWAQVSQEFGNRINAGLSAVRRMPTPAGWPDENFGGQRELEDDEVDDIYSDIEGEDLDDDDLNSGFDDDDEL